MTEIKILGNNKEERLSEQQIEKYQAGIGSLILNKQQHEYGDLIKNAEWDVFYHMSPMRESLLNWYSFEKGSELLEISSGFGALTGLLARKVEAVTVLEESEYRARCIAKRYEDYSNISILAGRLSELSAEMQYDYIVIEKAVRTRRELEEVFNKVCPLLKETGRLLFVCENRFGMKYWCGVPDSVTNTPFAGIRENRTGQLITRNDLVEALKHNDRIKGWKLYYPFPDEKLPQAIYSDDYLPKASVRDRVIPYYPPEQQQSLVCLENEICDDLIANGIFHIFANAFLVECSKCDMERDAIFAALSTDRGMEHGFATVITGKDTVQKRVLHPAGQKSLELIYRNQQELMERGICCVSHNLQEDFIEMPFVKEPSLIEYLKHLFLADKDSVEEVFDSLYESIKNSSEQVSFAECRLRDRALTEENAGVILKKAYIDMIPYNSFYNDGKIMFYDQEFVKECYPAKYVLFRALRYTYIYMPEAENIIPIQYFKNRYELSTIWHVFEKEEGRFVEDNRNYDLLTSFYNWAGVSRMVADENVQKLLVEKPVIKVIPPFKKKTFDISIYGKNEKLNRIKAAQMEMVREFMSICEENDLSFCAFYGTLLGAVRHKGYVPWDDDVDFAMPRKDYDKLIAIADTVIRHPFFLQTPENDAGCFYGGYCKLRNSMTTGLEERNKGNHCNQGIWIDIFPLDDVPLDETVKVKQTKRISFYQRLLLKKTYPDKRMLWDQEEKIEKRYSVLAKWFSRETLCRKLHEAFVEYDGERSGKLAVMARYRFENKYPEYDRQDLAFLIWEQYEDVKLPVPNGYGNILRQDYGKDYLIYPEEEKRKPHHTAVFDTEKSYIDYLAENS